MYSIRVKFERSQEVKFISHLDMMKAFERALRRAGLPIGYSKGFNPHPLMVFGLPLSVGMTSEAEYADFEMAEGTNPEVFKPEDFMKAMNKVLPQGIRITGAVRRYKNSNIMALVRKADYDIEAYSNGEHTIEEVKSSIGRLMERNAIMVKKKEKDGGYKEIDIRPMIKNLEAHRLPKKAPGYEEFRSAFLLKASVDAGSKSNLNPVMIVSALPEYAGINIDASRIHRTALYVESCGGLADPMKDALNEVPAGVCRKGEKGVAAG